MAAAILDKDPIFQAVAL